ncbi:MAG: hypothetical protein Q8L48_07715 [Archangium sp.]|nr:hypothetical protein [Archangium sp.]
MNDERFEWARLAGAVALGAVAAVAVVVLVRRASAEPAKVAAAATLRDKEAVNRMEGEGAPTNGALAAATAVSPA